ncbi:MAG TPA: hypothetical protein VFV71_08845 [Burkholderiales bacterium]|nr:hypothetical protein [Burkholderiales bacterium]
MSAYNIVRFRVKPGEEQRFVDFHRTVRPKLKGFVAGALVKTGDRAYCLVGEWRSFQAIVAARAQMIGMLDQTRDALEDLGGGLGVTDPVSGETVVKLNLGVAKKPARRKAAKKPAKKAAARKRPARKA